MGNKHSSIILRGGGNTWFPWDYMIGLFNNSMVCHGTETLFSGISSHCTFPVIIMVVRIGNLSE